MASLGKETATFRLAASASANYTTACRWRSVNINLNHTFLALPPETTARQKHKTRFKRLVDRRAPGTTDGRRKLFLVSQGGGGISWPSLNLRVAVNTHTTGRMSTFRRRRDVSTYQGVEIIAARRPVAISEKAKTDSLVILQISVYKHGATRIPFQEMNPENVLTNLRFICVTLIAVKLSGEKHFPNV
jgi:hypothetical protein